MLRLSKFDHDWSAFPIFFLHGVFPTVVGVSAPYLSRQHSLSETRSEEDGDMLWRQNSGPEAAMWAAEVLRRSLFLSLEDTCCAFSIQDDFRALILPWIEWACNLSCTFADREEMRRVKRKKFALPQETRKQFAMRTQWSRWGLAAGHILMWLFNARRTRN